MMPAGSSDMLVLPLASFIAASKKSSHVASSRVMTFLS